MSRMVEVNWNPDRSTLRQFGIVALVGFGLLAALAWNEALLFAGGLGAARPWVAGGLSLLGVVAAILALVAPGANRPLYVGLTLLALPIGFVVSYAILGLLFFGIIAPVGALLRILGRDPMVRQIDPEVASYWRDADYTRTKEGYFKQF